MFRIPLSSLSACVVAIFVSVAPVGLAAEPAPSPFPRLSSETTLTRIAFGSCLDEEKAPPAWQTILDRNPQLFMMVGDNVYADSIAGRYIGPDLRAMAEAYAALNAQPGFQRLRAEVPLLGVWDDHDYGVDDGGVEHPKKAEAKQLFADFFDVPRDDPMRSREGIYRASIHGPPGRRVQVILLDTRWFRSELKRTDRPNEPGRQRYIPDDDPSKTLLGGAQWQWLEQELRKPAEVRLIVSSIQVLADGHGWERWRNQPHELKRLFSLIETTQAKGVLLLSGDRHRAGLYRHIEQSPYPLYELTSSSLNAGVESRRPEVDPQRIGGRLYPGENFGYIEIDWDSAVIHLDVLSLPEGRRVRGVTVAIEELKP